MQELFIQTKKSLKIRKIHKFFIRTTFRVDFSKGYTIKDQLFRLFLPPRYSCEFNKGKQVRGQAT